MYLKSFLSQLWSNPTTSINPLDRVKTSLLVCYTTQEPSTYCTELRHHFSSVTQLKNPSAYCTELRRLFVCYMTQEPISILHSVEASLLIPYTTQEFISNKRSSCWHAIHTVKTVVDYYCNNGGSTVNLCALDLSKAFDKMDYNAQFDKLMERKLLVEHLSII